MMPLLMVWVGITMVLVALLIVRSRLQSHEADWLPIRAANSNDIRDQMVLEKKVHHLTTAVRVVESLDVILLVSLAAIWIYQGVNSVRW